MEGEERALHGAPRLAAWASMFAVAGVFKDDLKAIVQETKSRLAVM